MTGTSPVDFHRAFNPEGPWHLVTMVPDGALIARTFHADQIDPMRRFIDERNGRENIYFHPNPLKANVRNKKAKKDDVDRVEWIFIDIDDLEARNRIEAYSLRPTITVCSGGGYNLYWRLRTPTVDFRAAERIMRSLVSQLGGDKSVTDVCRILRQPGTTNLPNQVKIARGRTSVESYVVEELTDWSLEYDLEEFEALTSTPVVVSPPPADVIPATIVAQDLPRGLDERLQAVAITGDDPDHPRGKPGARYESRSEAVFAVACGLAKLGESEATIAGVLVNPAYKISESILEKRHTMAAALRQAHRAILQVSTAWPDGVDEHRGFAKRTFQNTQAAILRLGIEPYFDEFRQRLFISGQALQSYQGEVGDSVCLFVRDLINKVYGFDPGAENTRDAIQQLGNLNPTDPIREDLANKTWDGHKRVDTWLIGYAGADDNPYIRAVGAITLIAAVRRVRHPGVKFDTIPVLEGPQGSGKSSLIKVMAGEAYFADQELLTLDNKGQMEAIEGVWLYEISELAGMRFAEINRVKAFASRQVDRGRPAYGRFTVSRPRRGIFIGTTNDDHYLRDDTGNRRFLPIKTTTIDIERLKQDRDQLWAEAAHREAQGESIELPRDLWPIAAEEQRKRLEVDGWDQILEHVYGELMGGREVVSSVSLLIGTLEIPKGQLTNLHYRRLARIMPNHGWTGPETLTLPNGTKAKGYWRIPTDDQREPI